MRACLRGLAVRRVLLPMLVLFGVPSLHYAQDSAYYWNPVPVRIGSSLPTGSIDAVTTPGSRILTTNATGFGVATPASESLLFASIPSSPSGLIEWTAPNPSGGGMTSGSVAGVMLRFTENTSPGAPFVFAGVRQGTSGVELRWRVVQGGEVKAVAGAISGADFPAASRLKLEFIQGRVFLSYKKSSDGPTDPWRKRLAVEISGTGTVYSGLVLATGGSGSASLTVSNSDVRVVPARGEAPWVRLVEPFEPGYGNDRISTRESVFGWEDWSFESTLDVETGPAAQIYSGGDYWKWSREASAWTIDPDLEDRVTVYMTDIYPTTASEDAIDVYVRYGTISSQTAVPSVDTLIWDGASLLSNHDVTGVLGEGLWVFLATLPKAVYPDSSLQLVMGWTFAQTPGGLKNEASLDGLLLVSQGAQTDSNRDGLPDGFGGHFAPWLTPDGDFDGDGLTNAEEYVLGLSPTTSSSGVPPTVSVVKPASSPWLLARGRWSGTPAEVKAVYPGTSPPVSIKGYGLYLKTSENTIGFGSSRSAAAWKGDYLTTTDSLGVARAYIWVDAECPTPAGSSSTGYDINVRDFYASFKVRPYNNTSPGPVEIVSDQRRLTPVSTLNVDAPLHLAISGNWMAEVDGFNEVWMHRWDEEISAWSRGAQLDISTTGGIAMNSETLVAASGDSVHTLDFNAQFARWVPWATPLQSPDPWPNIPAPDYSPKVERYEWVTGSWEAPLTLALYRNFLAVGDPSWGGRVEIYEKGVSGWTLRSTLLPNSGAHSDAFGSSLAFSEDGQRLVVGAPGDAAGYVAGLYSGQTYTARVLNNYMYPEDEYGWGVDENGYPVWQVVGQHIVLEVREESVTAEIQPPAQPSAYVFERDVSGAWNQTARLIPPVQWPAVTYNKMEMFGAAVAAANDWVFVGAPCYNEGINIPPTDPLPQGGVYGFLPSGASWVFQEVELRSNPRFGEQLAASNGKLLAVASPASNPVEQAGLPGYMAVLDFDSYEILTAAEIVSDATNPVIVAEKNAVVFTTSAAAAQEYQWLPVVPWDATEGSALAGWLKAVDGDLANANASIEKVSLLTGPSSRWWLDTSLSQSGAPVHEAFETPPQALRVKLGAALESFAPGVDWLEVTAVDRAGDSYTEYMGIRVLTEIPSVPDLQSVAAVGGHFVRVAWTASAHSPAAYIVEMADPATLEHLLSQGSSPEVIDAIFSERGRVDGASTSYYHQVVDPEDVYTMKLAFRVRAMNEEGISAGSTPIIANLDEDYDLLPDWWEELHGGDLDPSLDDDSDGLTNRQEYEAGTNPLIADSDGDGTLDGADAEPLNAKINDLSFVLFTPVE